MHSNRQNKWVRAPESRTKRPASHISPFWSAAALYYEKRRAPLSSSTNLHPQHAPSNQPTRLPPRLGRHPERSEGSAVYDLHARSLAQKTQKTSSRQGTVSTVPTTSARSAFLSAAFPPS